MTAAFVVIEGLTGSGKSTVANILAAEYGWERPALLYDEIASAIRSVENDPKMLDVRFALYMAGVLRVGKLVEELLDAGRGVVMDSWVYRTIATHLALGSSAHWEPPAWLPSPDVAIFLDTTDEERARRISGRGQLSGYWKSECEKFTCEILENYRKIAPNLIWIDSSGSLNEVLSNVKRRLHGL